MADCSLSPNFVTSLPAGYFNTDGVIDVPTLPPTDLTAEVPSPSVADFQGYGAGITCTWLFKGLPFDPIQKGPISEVFLHFHSFNLVNAGDSVKIYSGMDATGTLLATYSGPSNVIPESVVADQPGSNSSLFVVFTSTGAGATGAGFGAYWQAGACLLGITTLSKPVGWFTDGSGPLLYATRLTCGWRIISTDPSALVSVTIVGEVEEGYDFLFVYDGQTNKSPLLARRTGILNETFTSTTNYLYVLLFIDKTLCFPGIRADYVITPSSSCSGSKMLTQSAARFSDGSSTVPYQPNTVCNWTITPQPFVNYIALYFDLLDLSDDTLSIYETNNPTALYVFSGSQIPDPIIYEGNGNLTLELRSNDQNEGQGFTIIYNAGKCIASTRIYAAQGVLTDGSGDQAEYGSNLLCQWLVTLNPDVYERIEFSFIYFSTEFRFDTLTVYDGDTDNTAAIVTYSGYNQTFDPSETTGASMLIAWQTEIDVVGPGWKIAWKGIPFPPPDYAVADYDTGPGIAFLILLMGTAVGIVILFIFFLAASWWTSPVIKHTSIPYNFVLLAMLFFCCFGFYPYIGEPTNGLCAWRPWTALLWITTFSMLLIKIYMIWGFSLMQSKEEKGVVFKPRYSWPYMLPAFLVLCLIVGINIVFLIIWMAVDYPRPTLHDTNNSNEVYYRCESDPHTPWIVIQYSYVGLLMIVGLIGAARVYMIPVSWNESKILSLTIVLIVVATIVFIAILYVVWDIPEAWLAIMGFGIWLNVMIVLVVYFGPKAFAIVASWFRSGHDNIDDKWSPEGKSGSTIKKGSTTSKKGSGIKENDKDSAISTNFNHTELDDL